MFLEEFIKLNVNTEMVCETCGIKYYKFFFQYINFKDDLLEYECLCCNKNYPQNSMKN